MKGGWLYRTGCVRPNLKSLIYHKMGLKLNPSMFRNPTQIAREIERNIPFLDDQDLRIFENFNVKPSVLKKKGKKALWNEFLQLPYTRRKKQYGSFSGAAPFVAQVKQEAKVEETPRVMEELENVQAAMGYPEALGDIDMGYNGIGSASDTEEEDQGDIERRLARLSRSDDEPVSIPVSKPKYIPPPQIPQHESDMDEVIEDKQTSSSRMKDSLPIGTLPRPLVLGVEQPREEFSPPPHPPPSNPPPPPDLPIAMTVQDLNTPGRMRVVERVIRGPPEIRYIPGPVAERIVHSPPEIRYIPGPERIVRVPAEKEPITMEDFLKWAQSLTDETLQTLTVKEKIEIESILKGVFAEEYEQLRKKQSVEIAQATEAEKQAVDRIRKERGIIDEDYKQKSGEVDALRKQIDGLKLELKREQDSIDALRVKKLSDELDTTSTSEKLRQEVEDLRRQLEQTKKLVEQSEGQKVDIEAQVKKVQEELDRLNKLRDTQLGVKKKQLEASKKKLEEEQKQLEASKKKLEDETRGYTVSLKDLREKQQELIRQTTAYDADAADLDRRQKQLDADEEGLSKKRKEYDAKITLLKQKKAEDEQVLEEQRKGLDKQIEELKRKHQKELDALVVKFEKEKGDLEEKQRKTREEVEASVSEARANLTTLLSESKKLQEQNAVLTGSIADQKAALSTLRSEVATVQEQLEQERATAARAFNDILPHFTNLVDPATGRFLPVNIEMLQLPANMDPVARAKSERYVRDYNELVTRLTQGQQVLIALQEQQGQLQVNLNTKQVQVKALEADIARLDEFVASETALNKKKIADRVKQAVAEIELAGQTEIAKKQAEKDAAVRQAEESVTAFIDEMKLRPENVVDPTRVSQINSAADAFAYKLFKERVDDLNRKYAIELGKIQKRKEAEIAKARQIAQEEADEEDETVKALKDQIAQKREEADGLRQSIGSEKKTIDELREDLRRRQKEQVAIAASVSDKQATTEAMKTAAVRARQEAEEAQVRYDKLSQEYAEKVHDLQEQGEKLDRDFQKQVRLARRRELVQKGVDAAGNALGLITDTAAEVFKRTFSVASDLVSGFWKTKRSRIANEESTTVVPIKEEPEIESKIIPALPEDVIRLHSKQAQGVDDDMDQDDDLPSKKLTFRDYMLSLDLSKLRKQQPVPIVSSIVSTPSVFKFKKAKEDPEAIAISVDPGNSADSLERKDRITSLDFIDDIFDNADRLLKDQKKNSLIRALDLLRDKSDGLAMYNILQNGWDNAKYSLVKGIYIDTLILAVRNIILADLSRDNKFVFLNIWGSLKTLIDDLNHADGEVFEKASQQLQPILDVMDDYRNYDPILRDLFAKLPANFFDGSKVITAKTLKPRLVEETQALKDMGFEQQKLSKKYKLFLDDLTSGSDNSMERISEILKSALTLPPGLQTTFYDKASTIFGKQVRDIQALLNELRSVAVSKDGNLHLTEIGKDLATSLGGMPNAIVSLDAPEKRVLVQQVHDFLKKGKLDVAQAIKDAYNLKSGKKPFRLNIRDVVERMRQTRIDSDLQKTLEEILSTKDIVKKDELVDKLNSLGITPEMLQKMVNEQMMSQLQAQGIIRRGVDALVWGNIVSQLQAQGETV